MYNQDSLDKRLTTHVLDRAEAGINMSHDVNIAVYHALELALETQLSRGVCDVLWRAVTEWESV